MAQQEAAACLAIALLVDDDKKGRGKTRNWIKRREEKGYFLNIVKELNAEDTSIYKEMMRFYEFKI